MARQKHFRLPDDVLEMINNRDKEIYPTENVLILAIQCSKPATTNDIIMQNIIISFPLSLFNLVPTSTAIHTRKLQRIPLSKSSGTPADIFEYIKLL